MGYMKHDNGKDGNVVGIGNINFNDASLPVTINAMPVLKKISNPTDE